jgi:hypothetical protein
MAHIRKLFLVIEVDEARDLSQGGSHDFPRFWTSHTSNGFPVFVVIGQDVIDLAVFQFSHMILDGIAQS